MRRITRSWHLLAAAVLALAGVGAGHVVEYLLMAPHGHERHELLAHTGHQYLPLALRVAAFLALASMVAVFLAAAAAAGGRSSTGRRIRWAVVLPLVQPLAFVALEVGERLAARASLTGLAPVLVAGLPLQVVFGLLGAALVGGLERAGRRVGGALRRTSALRRPRRSASRPTAAATPVSVVLWALAPTRGPPPVVVT